MSGVFEERPLDLRIHDRAGFDCGVPALDEYLRRYAEQNRKSGLGSVYVLVEPHAPERILGYYTLSAAEVDAALLPENERRRLPRYPVPCFRLGRLACRTEARRRGIGKRLLACAIDRCRAACVHVAAYALIVDAKDDTVRAFYAHFGFKAFSARPMAMYLALGAK
jgi:GNAT superfamily N-acetyltransferase